MRSIYCGELNESNLDQEVTLCGWVHRRRDHGGVIFVDLRDRWGLTQVVFDPTVSDDVHAIAEQIRSVMPTVAIAVTIHGGAERMPLER